MLKPHALIDSLSENLSYFITQIHRGLPLPQKNFLHESIIGLIRAGHPIVAQMARQIGRHDSFNADRTRLEYNLNNENQFDQKIKDNLPSIWLPFIREDTPIILDLSDIAKPLAKRMDYLATVRDGSSDQLVNGYWLVELYASVKKKNPIPILLEPFSHEHPSCRGQNPVILDALERVFTLTQGRGVLVMDRGGDARSLLDDWLDKKYRFVVRLRGDRDLEQYYQAFGGLADTVEYKVKGRWIRVNARHLAEKISTPHRAWRVVKSKGKRKTKTSQMGWVKVRLPGRKEVLTMVVSREAGRDTPLMILTNLPVESDNDARTVLQYYGRRWECEEGIRFLKSQVNLEEIRTFNWAAICRLILLAVVVMIYLCWLVQQHPRLTKRLIQFSQPLPDKPDFLLYRVMTGATEAINYAFYSQGALL